MRVALAVIFVFVTSPSLASEVLRTQTGAIAHWELKAIRLAVHPEARSRQLKAAQIEEAMDAARGSWNELPETRTRLVPLTTSSRPEVYIHFCHKGWPFSASEVGHTEFVADTRTGLVTSASIYINECDYKFVPSDEVAENRFDLQAVLAHEIGHVLGLGHSGVPDSLMFRSTGSAGVRRPRMDDRRGLATVYRLPPPLALPEPAFTPSTAPIPDLEPTPPARVAPPGDILAGMRIQGPKKGSAMIYTGEPTILPPIAQPPPTRKSSRRRPPPSRTSSLPQASELPDP